MVAQPKLVIGDGHCNVLLAQVTMITNNSCEKITVAEALARLPGPQGELSVTLFEHGSLVVKLLLSGKVQLSSAPSNGAVVGRA